jgi:FeS assembly SUF system protein
MFSWLGKKKESDAAAAVAPPTLSEAPVTGASPDAASTASPASAPVSDGGMNIDALIAPPPPSATSSQPQIGPKDEARTDALKPAVVEAISTVFDPEIPVNIYELGLIYEIAADADSRVGVKMTLTSPACPSAQQIPSEVRYKVKALDGVADCQVEIVWEPPWTKDMMSETAKLSLGIF